MELREEISAPYCGSQCVGIFQKMATEASGKNPVETGRVRINMPTIRDPLMNPSALVDFEDKTKLDFYNYAIGAPTRNQNWFEFDFLDRRVSVSGCAITASNRYIPIDWYLLGSTDAREWYAIELVDENGTGLAKNQTLFMPAVTQNNIFRYIRFVQQTNNDMDQDCWYFIQLRSFELFGTVYKKEGTQL